jgi:hypothetical protein
VDKVSVLKCLKCLKDNKTKFSQIAHAKLELAAQDVNAQRIASAHAKLARRRIAARSKTEIAHISARLKLQIKYEFRISFCYKL